MKTLRPRPDAIDTRVVFRLYSVLACGCGFLISLWGPMLAAPHLPGIPWGMAVVVRIVGAVIVGAGCLAAPLAVVDDRRVGQRALLWFAAGHAVVIGVVAMQFHVVFDVDLAELPAAILLSVVFIFVYLWNTAEGERLFEYGTSYTGIFGRPGEDGLPTSRSAYEEHIRQAAAQEERNRLARDLHDSIKQQIFVMHTAAATAQARLDGDRTGAEEAIDRVRQSAREAMTEMDALLDQLRATPLGNTGLVEAIRKQCEALGFRTGARVSLQLGSLPPNEALPPGAQTAVFRVAQEALANVGRHARASGVSVRLGQEDNDLVLAVEDDGAGFEEGKANEGMGLSNMRARAAEFDGRMSIRSAHGEGTEVRLAVPLQVVTKEERAIYRRRAILWGVYLAATVALTAWHVNDGYLLGEFPALDVPVAVLAFVIFARSAAAWWRLRERREGREGRA